MNLQLLVVTMNQNDFSLVEKMNIRCDAVIANQSYNNGFSQTETGYGKVTMVTTHTRGVGLNRNIALLASEADILLFADDDLVYNDDMPQKVTEAFENNPEADVIIFSICILKDGKITERRNKCGRLHLWNSMRFGTYAIAVRRKPIIDNNITFNQCFGGGCDFSAGEDSLFLKACFDCGLKVFSDNYILGSCCKDTSSWFKGYNEKYFYDKGVLVRKLFPKSAYIMALYFGAYFKRETDIGLLKRLSLVYRGVNAGKNMIPFKEEK
ncbi:MAG: glycosyltransferase [Clostridia bacterium]|nr:glycosyltransferase [Clostridia bacterium]